ncbi:MAG: ribonuclease HII [Proteobacteria bacterium]|nr:ribonuclease HII [Pseudomonadota bacterium]
MPKAGARPNWSHEKALGGVVAGVDEAGRGPWAGPVTAAAVILNPKKRYPKLDDSKKLDAETREALYVTITESSQWAVGHASVDEIDSINILEATKLAMARAVAQLSPAPCVALIDGNRAPQLPCRAVALVGGDGLSLSVAAASVIAKVTRDRIMAQLALEHPGYGWERNAGYGTALHQEALARLGVTPHHRRSFRPIRELLEQGA